MKKCTSCKKILDIDLFYNNKSEKDGLSHECKECHKIKIRKYYVERRKKLRKIIYLHYGNKCNCCGLDDVRFLTIDHVNNDGCKEKSRNNLTLLSRIIRNNFPTNFQLLCWNCNGAKSVNGGTCPHNI